MMIKTITKRFSFCYGHHLPNYSGKCKNQHGHNSILEVEVCGNPFDRSYDGMIIDLKKLKELVEFYVIEKLDHKNLNEFLIVTPTIENINQWVWDELEKIFGKFLVRVRVSESDSSWSEIKR